MNQIYSNSIDNTPPTVFNISWFLLWTEAPGAGLTLSSHHAGLSACVTVLRDWHCQPRWNHGSRWSGFVCVSLCACARSSAYICACCTVRALTYCWSAYARVLGPWMYPPAGDLRGAPVGSGLSGRQRETAGHWCWRFGSERVACYGRTTPLPWAAQSRRHRRKLWQETIERQERDF